MKRMKSLALIVLIVMGTVFLLPSRVSANPPRDINVYVIKAGDSASSWIGSVDNVYAGVQQAVNDARDKSWVKLDGENIPQLQVVTSTADLYNLAVNPPDHAVFINTHGEVVPTPEAYTQNDGYSGGDAGDSISSDTYVIRGIYTGFLASPDTNDWYKTPVNSWNVGLGDTIQVKMTPSPGSDFDLELYDPTGRFRAGSYYAGDATDTVTCLEDLVGNWSVRAYIYNGFGDYKLDISFIYGSTGPGCPYASTWNGSEFVIDNDLLTASDESIVSDVVDHYLLQQPLAQKEDGTCSLLLSESENEHDFFDRVRLIAVDHPSNAKVAISSSGEILTYTNPSPPVSAIDNEKVNVKSLLSSIDDSYYEGYNGSYVILNFGDLDVSQGAKLILRPDRKIKKSIYVQVQDKKGNWNDIATIIPRTYWTTEIIDMSSYLPDVKGNLKVRLYFTANHKLDFVGLDTSPQAKVEVQQAQLLSAIYSKSAEDVKAKLGFDDKEYAKLLPGQQIELKFVLPSRTEIRRDFILVIKGRYTTLTSSPTAFPAGPDPPVPRIDDWFDLIEKNCREHGWIWANVAGYAFYYGSNTNMVGSLVTAGELGLKRFIDKNVVARYYDGHQALLGIDFNNDGFRNTYDYLAPYYPQLKGVGASRPLPLDMGLLVDMLGAYDNGIPGSVAGDLSFAIVAMAMNKTVLNQRCNNGMFIYSGLSADADRDGVENTYSDDFLKGYIATAMAIEEARSLIIWPEILSQVIGNTHAAVFQMSMRPAAWWKKYDDALNRYYYQVNCVFSVGAHYDYYQVFYPIDWWFYWLSEADFDLSASNDVWFKIDTTRSGLDTGNKNTELMYDLYWWAVSSAAGAIPGYGLVLGSAIGLVPILQKYYAPQTQKPEDFGHVWANETLVDPSPKDDRGTVSFPVEIRFYNTGSSGWQPYTFTVRMASWIHASDSYGYYNDRDSALSYATDVTLQIKW